MIPRPTTLLALLALVSGCSPTEPPAELPAKPPATEPVPTVPTAPAPPTAAPEPAPEPAEADPDPVPEAAPDPAATAARARLLQAELSLLGGPAPALTVDAWIQGRGDLTSGKATLVVFFATEAPDAPPAVGAAEALWRRARSRGLHVVGLASPSTSREAVTAWLRTEAVTFPVALDSNGRTAEAWRRSSPVSAALVKEGRVVWTGNPARVTDELLARHL